MVCLTCRAGSNDRSSFCPAGGSTHDRCPRIDICPSRDRNPPDLQSLWTGRTARRGLKVSASNPERRKAERLRFSCEEETVSRTMSRRVADLFLLGPSPSPTLWFLLNRSCQTVEYMREVFE